MGDAESGTLLLADISGYTGYLAGVELEHAHDIIADLINLITEQTDGPFELTEIEGDAIFTVAPEGAIDGSGLMAMLDSCYAAFVERLRDIERNTTCPCGACKAIPSLSVKFIVHHGSYIRHEVAGRAQLIGPEVILAHRLLKNRVIEATGISAYALITDPCVSHHEIDRDVLQMKPHGETYESLGSVDCCIVDMKARYQEAEERRKVYVAREDAWIHAEREVSGVPSVVWDLVTAPDHRTRWTKGVSGVNQQNPGGVRGAGTTNHCMHGKSVTIEHVLDWKPHRYATWTADNKMGSLIITLELRPIAQDRTVVEYRLKRTGKQMGRVLHAAMKPMVRKSVEDSMDGLVEYASHDRDPSVSGSPISG